MQIFGDGSVFVVGLCVGDGVGVGVWCGGGGGAWWWGWGEQSGVQYRVRRERPGVSGVQG